MDKVGHSQLDHIANVMFNTFEKRIDDYRAPIASLRDVQHAICWYRIGHCDIFIDRDDILQLM